MGTNGRCDVVRSINASVYVTDAQYATAVCRGLASPLHIQLTYPNTGAPKRVGGGRKAPIGMPMKPLIHFAR